ncbi:hypothetical protein Tco_0738298 [Tanacetum coccineum]
MALGYQNTFYLKQAHKQQQSFYNGNVLIDKHDPLAVYGSEETLRLAQESLSKPKVLDDTPSQSVARKFLNEVKDTIVTLQQAAKFVRDVKSFAKEADESLDKITVLEKEND